MSAMEEGGPALDSWVSPHFTLSEFRCHRCGIVHGVPHPALLELLEEVRERIGGKPVYILSGSRCSEHQGELVQQGYHAAKAHPPHVPILLGVPPELTFLAADARSSMVSAFALAAVAEKVMPQAGIGVRAYGGSFVHLDVCHLAGKPYWRPGRRW